MRSRIGVGVVGRGVWGCHSLEQELQKFPGVGVVAVTAGPQWGASCFEDQVAAGRRYAAELGADYREDWREVVEAPDVDVVSLMTSPATRREPALAAFAAGKHVVVDKPLAASVEDARAIADAEQRSAGIGFMLCGYHPRETVRRVRAEIDGRNPGDVRHISVELLFTGGMIPGFTPSDEWLAGTSGGELTTIGSHALRTLLWLAPGEPVSVSARTACLFSPEYRSIGAEDWAEAYLAFDDGMLGTVRCGRVPYETWEEPFSVDVIGSQGGASVRANRALLSPSGVEFTDPSPKATLLDRSFETFLDAINGRGQPATTFEDGLLITRILDAAYRSARETRAVAIER